VIRSKCQEVKDDPGRVKEIPKGADAPYFRIYALGSAVTWLMNYAVTKVNQREK